MPSITYPLTSVLFALALTTPPAAIGTVYHCALPTSKGQDRVVADPGTIKQKSVLDIKLQANGDAQLHIHPIMLDGIVQSANDSPVTISRLTNTPLAGRRITAQNDPIAANFASNTLRQARKTQPLLQLQDINLSGFKTSLSAQREQGAGKRNPAATVQIRIILDWSYLSGSAAPVHRGAFVASRAIIDATGKPAQEEFYRFLPSRRPFRALTCIEAHALSKTLL